jgi:hypothetical protein
MATELVRSTICVSKPVDWFARESLTLLAPDGGANVIVSSEPLDPTIDSGAYAHIQGELLRTEFPEYREHSFESRQVFSGRPGFLRRFSWQPANEEPVTQIQLYFAEGGRGYTATATSPTDDFPDYELVLLELLNSLQI